jgi:hypothetical protein
LISQKSILKLAARSKTKQERLKQARTSIRKAGQSVANLHSRLVHFVDAFGVQLGMTLDDSVIIPIYFLGGDQEE